MIGFKLDNNGDINVDNKGNLLIIEDDDKFENLRMIIQCSLRTFLGEVFTNLDLGCNWLRIFQTKETKSKLENLIKKEVQEKAFQAAMEWDLPVKPIDVVSILLDRETREVHLNIKYDGRDIVV